MKAPLERLIDVLRSSGLPVDETLRASLAEALEDPERPMPPQTPRHTWAESDASETPEGYQLPPRYRPVGVLGTGGMGKVVKAQDQVLGRTVAVKIARSDLSPAARSRFLAEARITSQLEHPGIVPVYDHGALPTGEPYYTMPVVRGRTLWDALREVHVASSAGRWGTGSSGLGLHRLLDAFRAVAEAMAYAHSQGVIHRDLKPDNILLGAFGETLVVDWGLAKVIGSRDPDDEPPMGQRGTHDTFGTLFGAVVGTPGYMAPEQAVGELHRVDARSDVHALGAVLYEILTARPPFDAPSPFDVVAQTLHQAPPPLVAPGPIPPELAELVAACLAKEPEERPADAGVVARAVAAWSEGASRRERAMAEVTRADGLAREARTLRQSSAQRAAQAERLLRDVPAHAPEDGKREAWRLQDAAAADLARADLSEVQSVEALGAALRASPDLPEAHDRLAAHYHRAHVDAEDRGEHDRAQQLELLLRAHDARGTHAPYLEGAGALTIHTDPPGAEVVVYRYETRDRRRIAIPWGRLGTTPLEAAPLPMGSYRVELRHPARATVRYPVEIRRQHHWDGVRPGERDPTPIRLPFPKELGPDDRYVPAGWFRAGGDPHTEWPWAGDRLWLDGFVMRRFPYTNREYLGFLHALLVEGREEEAQRHAPREAGAAEPAYGRDGDRFVLRPDADGDVWSPEWPVVLVDWEGARACAAWEAQQSGLPWRLPWELEREKAARGVDGRLYPWGDHFDASWACLRDSHPSRPLPATVDAFPVDQGPYGIRGLAGGVHDWCLDAFRPEAPQLPADRVDERPDLPRAVRGGNWSAGARWARSASRGVVAASLREAVVGFRLCRPYPG